MYYNVCGKCQRNISINRQQKLLHTTHMKLLANLEAMWLRCLCICYEFRPRDTTV